MQKQVKTLENKLKENKTSVISCVVSEVNKTSEVSRVVHESQTESKEIENRRTNVVCFDIPESVKENPENRKVDDKRSFQEMVRNWEAWPREGDRDQRYLQA